MDAGNEVEVRKSNYLEFEQRMLLTNVTLCDQKAGILLPFTGVALIWALGEIGHTFEAASAARPLIHLAQMFYYAGMAGFLVTAFFSMSVIRPRFYTDPNDLVFWHSKLFRLPEPEFVTTVTNLPDDTLEEAMTKYLHRLARILTKKFSNLRRAIFLAELSFVIMVLAKILQTIS